MRWRRRYTNLIFFGKYDRPCGSCGNSVWAQKYLNNVLDNMMPNIIISLSISENDALLNFFTTESGGDEDVRD